MSANNHCAGMNTEEQPRELCGKKNTFWHRNGYCVIMLAMCVLFAGISIFCFSNTILHGTTAVRESYNKEKSEAHEKLYDEIYQKSYQYAEKQHHVSNEISITIESLQEEAKLEVLKFSEVEYVTPDDKDGNLIQKMLEKVTDLLVSDVISWLEVPGYGVFTVNLKASEFIIDNERQYVLIRIPEPEVSEFTIDYANVEILNFEDTGVFKNSAKAGEDKAREQLQVAELRMRQSAGSNQRFQKAAKKGAESILASLVKQLNPKLDHLVVEVEFFD